MKLRLPHLVLLAILPGTVYSGTFSPFSVAESLLFESNETERIVEKQSFSYDLSWNQELGTFDASPVPRGRAIILNNSIFEDEEKAANPAPHINNEALAI